MNWVSKIMGLKYYKTIFHYLIYFHLLICFFIDVITNHFNKK